MKLTMDAKVGTETPRSQCHTAPARSCSSSHIAFFPVEGCSMLQRIGGHYRRRTRHAQGPRSMGHTSEWRAPALTPGLFLLFSYSPFPVLSALHSSARQQNVNFHSCDEKETLRSRRLEPVSWQTCECFYLHLCSQRIPRALCKVLSEQRPTQTETKACGDNVDLVEPAIGARS